MTGCRFGPQSHLSRRVVAVVTFATPSGIGYMHETAPVPVCRVCSRNVLQWMASGRLNAAGQCPVSHYPIESKTGQHYIGAAISLATAAHVAAEVGR